MATESKTKRMHTIDPPEEPETLISALRQPMTPTQFVRLALESDQIARIDVQQMAPNGIASRKVHEYDAPPTEEENVETLLQEQYGEARYKFVLILVGTQKIYWSRTFPIPPAYVAVSTPADFTPIGGRRGAAAGEDGIDLSRSLKEVLSQSSAANVIKILGAGGNPATPAPSDVATMMKPIIDAVGALVTVATNLQKAGTGGQSEFMEKMLLQQMDHNHQLQLELARKRDDEKKEPSGVVKTVNEIADLAESLGWDAKGKGGGVDWVGVVSAGAPILERMTDQLASAIEGRPRVTVERDGTVRHVVRPAPDRAPAEEERATMAKPAEPSKEFKEILDKILEELQKPKDDRDTPGLGFWLQSLIIDPDGGTVFDRLVPLSRTRMDLAQFTLRQIDPRLADPELRPALSDLFAWVREQIDAERREEAEPA